MSYLFSRLMKTNTLTHSSPDMPQPAGAAASAPASPEADRKPFHGPSPSPEVDRKPILPASPSPEASPELFPEGTLPSPTDFTPPPEPDVEFNARLRRATSDALHQLWIVEMGSHAERQVAHRAARTAAVAVCDVLSERLPPDATNTLQCLLERYGEIAQITAERWSPDMDAGPHFAAPDEMADIKSEYDDEVVVKTEFEDDADYKVAYDVDEDAYEVDYESFGPAPGLNPLLDFDPARPFNPANPPKLDKGKGRAVPVEPVEPYYPTWDVADDSEGSYLTREEILAMSDPSSDEVGATSRELSAGPEPAASERAVSEAGSETAGITSYYPAEPVTPSLDTRALSPLVIPHSTYESSVAATSPSDARTPDRPEFVRAAGVSPEVRRRPPPSPLYPVGLAFGLGDAGAPFTPAYAAPVNAPPPLTKRKRRSEVERLELVDSVEELGSPAPRTERPAPSLAATSTKRKGVDDDEEDEVGTDTPVAKRTRPSRTSAPPPPPKSKPRSRTWK